MPERSGDSAVVVFHDPAGIDRPEAQVAIGAYLDDVRTLPRVAAVSSPVDSAAQIAADRSVAFAAVDFTPDGVVPLETAAAAMAEKAAALEQAGVEVEFGGYLFQEVEIPASEVFGLLAAAVILLVAFGSVVAMGLPIVTRPRRGGRRPSPASACGPPSSTRRTSRRRWRR